MEHCRASASAKVITKSCGNFHEGFGATSAQTSQHDAYRKPLKLSRSAALVKLATDHLAELKEPAEKLWEGAVEHMFPTGNGVKGDDPR